MNTFESLQPLFNEKKYQDCIAICESNPELFLTSDQARAEDLYCIYGKSYYNQSAFEQAHTQFSKGLKVLPDSKELIKFAAFTCQKLEEWTQAIAHWKHLVSLFPENLSANLHMAYCYVKSGDNKEAEKVLLAVHNKWPENPQILKTLSNLLKKETDWQQVVQLWKYFADIFSDYHNIQLKYADTLLAYGQYNRADKAFFAIKEAWPEDSAAFIGYAKVAFQQNFLNRAVKRWRIAAEAFPDDDYISLQEANLLSGVGRHKEASRSIEAITAKNPESLNVHKARASFLASQGQHKEMVELWIKALESHSKAFAPYNRLARLYTDVGQFNEAANILRTATEKWPQQVSFQAALARIYEQQGDFENALKIWNKVLDDRDGYLMAYDQKITCLIELGRLTEAKEVLELMRATWANHPMTLKASVSFGRKSYKRDFAIEACKQLIEIFPEETKYKLLYAQTLRKFQLVDRAETYLASALKEEDKNSKLYIAYAETARAKGNYELAKTRWQQAKEIEPTRLDVDLAIFDMNLRLGQQDDAVELANRLGRKYPKSPKVLDIVAKSKLLLGEQSDAKDIWQTLVIEHKSVLFPDSSVEVEKLSYLENDVVVDVVHPLLNQQQTIRLRLGTTDVSTFRKIFIRQEYDIVPEIGFQPKFIVDCGANVGYSTLQFAKLFPEAELVAVEPDAENFSFLVFNTRAEPRISNLCAAIWPDEGALRLQEQNAYGEPMATDSFRVEQQSFDELQDAEVPEGQVEAVSIVTILNDFDYDEIDVLKIDIEGAERAVFSSNFEAWLPKVKILIIELHDRFEPGCYDAVFAAIGKYDFEYYSRGENIFFFRSDIAVLT